MGGLFLVAASVSVTTGCAPVGKLPDQFAGSWMASCNPVTLLAGSVTSGLPVHGSMGGRSARVLVPKLMSTGRHASHQSTLTHASADTCHGVGPLMLP